MSRTPKQPRRIFLSYTRRDVAAARAVKTLLEIGGAKVFMDEDAIRPGTRWKQEIREGLDTADVMCVLWSEATRHSRWVRREYRAFTEMHPNRPCVPLCADRTPLPPILAERQAPPEFLALANFAINLRKEVVAGHMPRKQAEERLADHAGTNLAALTSHQRKVVMGMFSTGFSLALLLDWLLRSLPVKVSIATLGTVGVAVTVYVRASSHTTAIGTTPPARERATARMHKAEEQPAVSSDSSTTGSSWSDLAAKPTESTDIVMDRNASLARAATICPSFQPLSDGGPTNISMSPDDFCKIYLGLCTGLANGRHGEAVYPSFDACLAGYAATNADANSVYGTIGRCESVQICNALNAGELNRAELVALRCSLSEGSGPCVPQ